MDSLPSTREEAWRTGSKTYFTGKSCINNHIAYRYTQNGSCSECINPRLNPSAKIDFWNERVKFQQERKAQRDLGRARVEARSHLFLFKLHRMPEAIADTFTAIVWTYAAMRYSMLQLKDCKGRGKLSWFALAQDHPKLLNVAHRMVKDYYGRPEVIDQITTERDRRRDGVVADIQAAASVPECPRCHCPITRGICQNYGCENNS